MDQARWMAADHLKASQRAMKQRYDQRAAPRSFSVGEEVLALEPVPGHALAARFDGPFVITGRSGPNYVIKMPGRRKSERTVHINRLKKYHSSAGVAAIQVECDDTEKLPVTTEVRLCNSAILQNPLAHMKGLSVQGACDLVQLLQKFPDLFGDVPKVSKLPPHDVDVGEAVSIKQAPYRMNPTKQLHMEEEVKFLLQNQFVVPSESQLASPCPMVPKPDGSMHMSTDYHRVNEVTKADCYPLPHMDDVIDAVGGAKFVSKLDLLKGYYQIPLIQRSKEISAFITPDGLFQYNVLSFG